MTPTERRQRISDVCESAAQLRPEDRDAFVERACAGDAGLLQEVVSALSGGAKPTTKTIPEPPPFQRIARYQITGTIGSGGSGRVYSALDAAVGREVAIKVLNAPGDPMLVERFHAEARTVANLHHKNIVTLHEYGEEAGVPYLVMEYLNGTTLLDLIAEGSLSLLEKLEIMSEVADGLHYAHVRGITHRDVKPANIMRLTDGSVKIMDFGIARLGAQTGRLTQSGLLIGSLMYMAPEQFNGVSDTLTDVFSYGVTFYELLTGKNPFASPEPAVIIFRIANTSPPPVRSLTPECPAALDRIVSKILARDRDARYSSLSDVLADTRGILLDLRRDEALRLYTEAKRSLAVGQLDVAKTSVRKALDLDPAQEDARKLRSDIEEVLRHRDAATHAESLMDEAEKAVQDQKFEAAGCLLDSIKELAVSNPKLQGRMDWASAQVERGRNRERLLNGARADLRRENLTEAFRAVSELLASDPGSGPGKDLLQEVRNRMAAADTRRRYQEELAQAEDLLRSGEIDQAIFRLAEMERRHPEFAEAGVLRVRAEAQKDRDARARRFAQVAAEVTDLLQNGLFDMARVRIDELLIEFPNPDSSENQALHALRKQASEGLETGEGGGVEVAASPVEAAALDHWREAIGKLDDVLGPAPAQPFATERELPFVTEQELPPTPHGADPREQAIRETLAKVQSLEAAARYTEAAQLLEEGLREHGPEPRLLEAQQRVAEGLGRWRAEAIVKACKDARSLRKQRRFDEAASVLEACDSQHPGSRAISDLLLQIRKDRDAPPRRMRKRALAIWVALDVIAALIVILLLVRPAFLTSRFTFLAAKNRTDPTTPVKLKIDEPAGPRTAVRGKDFALDLRASGGSPPLSWVLQDGSMPPGLSLDSATGRIAGVPVTSNVYIFLVKLADSASHSAERAVTIEVVDPPDAAKPSQVDTPPAIPAAPPPSANNSTPSNAGKRVSKAPDAGGPTVTNPKSAAVPTAPGRKNGSSSAPDTGAAAIASNPNAGMLLTAAMWPVDGGDARRSGYAPYRGVEKPRLAWSAPAGTTEPGSPLIGADGRVYVRSGREHVLRAVENGRVVWSVRLPLDDQVSFGPDGSVQLSSFPGKTKTLNRDGVSIQQAPSEMKWLGLYVWRGHSYKSNGISPPGSTSTTWVFMRPDDPSWKVEVDSLATLPAIDESGVLYVGTAKGTIYAVNDNKTILWTYPTGEGDTKGLAVTRARDILAAVGQSLVSVHEGRLKWKFQGPGDGAAFPPIHDQKGTIYFGKGSDFYAVSSAGKEIWRVRLGGPVTTAPAMDRSGRIYVATATQLYCISDVDVPDPPQAIRAF